LAVVEDLPVNSGHEQFRALLADEIGAVGSDGTAGCPGAAEEATEDAAAAEHACDGSDAAEDAGQAHEGVVGAAFFDLIISSDAHCDTGESADSTCDSS
jgi:hypothetical protein